jgi:hypothetical protein
MRVRSLSKLSGLVHTSESNGSVLEIQRIGFRSFWVQNDDSGAQSRRSRLATASRLDDFVYDTGFEGTPAPVEPSPRPGVRFGLLRSPLVACSIVLAVGASMFVFAMSDSEPGSGWFGNGSAKHLAVKSKRNVGQKSMSSPASEAVTQPANSQNCINESIVFLSKIRNWDDSMNRLPRSWTVLNDVALGGVEQIVARPDCESTSGKVLVINLIREQSHWKLKSAAPAGPHF